MKIRQRDVSTGAVTVRNYINLLPQKMRNGTEEVRNVFRIF